MAEGGVRQSSAEKINCSICLERFKSPKLLPCYHSFCRTCLDTYVGKNSRANKFPCPLCRTEIEIPQDGVEKFQSNFYIETASTELSKDGVPCDICGPKSSATHRCTDCDENLCTSCSEFHLKMKLARNHKLAELTAFDSKTKRKLVTRVVCPEHPNEELKFVCKQCGDKLLCIDCKLTEHENHNTKHVTNEAKLLREELSGILTGKTIDEQIHKLRDQVSAKTKTVATLNTNFKKDLQDIKKQAEQMHEIVDDIVAEIRQTATEFYTSQVKKTESEKKEFEQKHQSCVSFRENVRLLLDHESDINILKKGVEIRNATEVLHQPVETDGQGEYVQSFRPGNIDREKVKSCVGSFTGVARQMVRPAIRGKESLKLLSKFTLPLSGEIIGIAPVNNNKSWASCFNHDKVYLVDLQGNVERMVDIVGGCDFVTTNADSECVVSCVGKKCISRVTSSGEVKTVIDDLYMYPHGLAYRKGSCGEEELIYTCTNSDGFVGSMGYTKQRFRKKDTILASDVKVPVRVAIEPLSGKMCLADFRNQRLTLHDRNGAFLSECSKDSIGASSVVFYETNNLLVCSYNNDIRLVSLDGRQVILLEGQLFKSVAVDDDNRLWVGLDSGGIEVYQIQ